MANNGLEDALTLPPLFSPDPCAPALLPTVTPMLQQAASIATSNMLDELSDDVREDLDANQTFYFRWHSGGLINMIMSSKRGDGYTRHLKDVLGGEENKFPDTVGAHLKNILHSGSFIDTVAATDAKEDISGDIWGIDLPREFVTDIEDKDLGERFKYEQSKKVTKKQPDVILKWDDYNNNDKVDYRVEYTSFDIEGIGEPDAYSKMTDYFRIRIEADPDIKSVPGFNSTVTPIAGFEGEQRSESEMQELVDKVADNELDLNIDDHLNDLKSPRNSLYAQYIIENMRNMAPEASDEIDSNNGDIFGAYYGYCDVLLKSYLGKFSESRSSRLLCTATRIWRMGKDNGNICSAKNRL